MFRIFPCASGLALPRHPVQHPYEALSQLYSHLDLRATTHLPPGNRKSFHTKASRATNLPSRPDLPPPEPADKPKSKRTRRKPQTKSNADSTVGVAHTAKTPLEEDGGGTRPNGRKLEGESNPKPTKTGRKKASPLEAFGPGIREGDELVKYLTSGYNKFSSLGDTKRVHLIDRKLCDDVLERMKPSLEKHKGCDIIDLNPGPGIWSSAIHGFLNPRTHILMEPDYAMYEPLLQPLLDSEGSTYKLIPKTGLVWDFLQKALSPELLPHQTALERGDPRLEEPNDTLLLVANLGYNPRKPYRGFPSIASLVIHQLLSAARSHSLFHKYGLIRMLIWVDDQEKITVLPRAIGDHRKSTIEAEVTCSDIVEVASSTNPIGTSLRDQNIDRESSVAVLRRMEEAGIKTPENRRGSLQIEAAQSTPSSSAGETKIKREFYKELEDLERRLAAGDILKFPDTPEGRLAANATSVSPEWTRMGYLARRVKRLKREEAKSRVGEELRELREGFATNKYRRLSGLDISSVEAKQRVGPPASYYTPEYKQLMYLRARRNNEFRTQSKAKALCDEHEAIMSMRKQLVGLEGSAAKTLQQELEHKTNQWNEEVALSQASPDLVAAYILIDNRTAFYQDPPILYWDKRKAEPIKIAPGEFYPKSEMALLDFHPRPLWPVLRENFPANYDVFEYIISNLFILPSHSVREGLTSLAPGAFDWLVSECPSLTDPFKGGNPDLGSMRVRCLTLEMFEEIMEAWMKWPFRPSRYEMLSKMGSDVHDPDADEIWEADA